MVTLATGAFAVDVTHTQVYLLFSLLASVILASLLVSPSLRLSELSLRVHAPRRVFVGAEVSFVVECAPHCAGPEGRVAPRRGPVLAILRSLARATCCP